VLDSDLPRVPPNPKIYHITHVDNLAGITEASVLWSDAKRIELGLECRVVGMSKIKERRLREIEVDCHTGTMVGEYAPFYFCPRSIMLYIFHMGNHPELTYKGGQRPIVHLQSDLHTVVAWAEEQNRRWAFSTVNAGTYYTRFYASLDQLEEVNWTAVRARDFRSVQIKDGKQAEFLMYESFPWTLVEKVGVINTATVEEVREALAGASHTPAIDIERSWYY
jgi:hypothetical protein